MPGHLKKKKNINHFRGTGGDFSLMLIRKCEARDSSGKGGNCKLCRCAKPFKARI